MMKSFYLPFVLVICVTGSLAADGDLREKCIDGSSNPCKDINAFCDDSDPKNKLCACKAGWIGRDGRCVRGANQPCGPSQCLAYGWCDDAVCTCDAARGYVPSADNSTCGCPATQEMRPSDGKCIKPLGADCTSSAECGEYTVCNAGTCECDAANHFIRENNQCLCNISKSVYHAQTNKCVLKKGQECTATSQCIPGKGGVICDQTCQCDTNGNFIDGADFPCVCAVNHRIRADKRCGKTVGQDCGAGDVCVDNAICSRGKCTCDVANDWSTNSDNICYCSDVSNVLKKDGTCGKDVGQVCQRDSQCLDYARCLPDANDVLKCTCDSTKHRVKSDNNNKQCVCNADTVEDSKGICRKVVGQSCSDVSECVATRGMLCKEVNLRRQCTCDTTKHYAAGAGGDSTCSCTPAEKFHKLRDGSCAIKVGYNCSQSTAFCVPGAVCDKKSQLCVCDPTNNYRVGAVGDTECSCNTESVKIPGTHICGKKYGGKCTSSGTNDVCTDRASCTLDGTSGSYLCKCSGTPMPDGACSSASAVVASLGLLMMGLLMTSRLL